MRQIKNAISRIFYIFHLNIKLLLQFQNRVQNRMMFHFARNNSPHLQILHCRTQNPIIGLCSTRCKQNLLCCSIQSLSYTLSRQFQNTFGVTPQTMRRRRISVILRHTIHHHLNHFGTHRCCRSIVEIYFFHN